ncbi:MAG: hypothetical protein CM1200mP29_03120 [Verrucomicrobiota bacterium]|nr:MAG: hypothetical protein CM1200mP29_03120 [Verrucomicrobiota bacterium]
MWSMMFWLKGFAFELGVSSRVVIRLVPLESAGPNQGSFFSAAASIGPGTFPFARQPQVGRLCGIANVLGVGATDVWAQYRPGVVTPKGKPQRRFGCIPQGGRDLQRSRSPFFPWEGFGLRSEMGVLAAELALGQRAPSQRRDVISPVVVE